jgi:hypothetical protein
MSLSHTPDTEPFYLHGKQLHIMGNMRYELDTHQCQFVQVDPIDDDEEEDTVEEQKTIQGIWFRLPSDIPHTAEDFADFAKKISSASISTSYSVESNPKGNSTLISNLQKVSQHLLAVAKLGPDSEHFNPNLLPYEIDAKNITLNPAVHSFQKSYNLIVWLDPKNLPKTSAEFKQLATHLRENTTGSYYQIKPIKGYMAAAIINLLTIATRLNPLETEQKEANRLFREIEKKAEQDQIARIARKKEAAERRKAEEKFFKLYQINYDTLRLERIEKSTGVYNEIYFDSRLECKNSNAFFQLAEDMRNRKGHYYKMEPSKIARKHIIDDLEEIGEKLEHSEYLRPSKAKYFSLPEEKVIRKAPLTNCQATLYYHHQDAYPTLVNPGQMDNLQNNSSDDDNDNNYDDVSETEDTRVSLEDLMDTVYLDDEPEKTSNSYSNRK